MRNREKNQMKIIDIFRLRFSRLCLKFQELNTFARYFASSENLKHMWKYGYMCFYIPYKIKRILFMFIPFYRANKSHLTNTFSPLIEYIEYIRYVQYSLHCSLVCNEFLCTDSSYSFLDMLMLQEEKSLVCSQRFFGPGRLNFFLLAYVFDVRAGKTQAFDSGIRRPLCSNRRIYVVFGITEIGPK